MRLSLAELYRRNENLPQAISSIKAGLARDHEDRIEVARAKAALAGLYLADGKLDEAKTATNEILEEEPKNVRALLIRSQILLREGVLTEAIATLRTILKDNPRSSAALALLSRAFLRSNQRNVAVDTLSQLVDVNPRNSAVRVQLAQLIASEGRIETALSQVDEALERSPNYIPALATKADLLVALGRLEQAKEITAKIAGLPKGKVTSLKLEGRIERVGGNPEGALKAFKQIHELDTQDWSAIEGIVVAYAGLKDLSQAEALLLDIVDTQPEHQRAWIRLGDVYRVQKKQPEAIRAYERAIKIDPTLAAPHSRLAQYYYSLGQPNDAIATLRDAVAANQKGSRFKLPLALALERNQQFKAAIKVYEELVVSGERSLIIANNLSALIADHAYTDSKKIEQALDLVKSLHGSDNALVLDTIGWLNFRAGNTADAISFLRRAVSLDANIGVVNYHLGQVYHSAGDLDLARQHLTAAIPQEKQGNTPAAYVAVAKKILEKLPKSQ